MKSVRRRLLYVLILAMPLSSWAGVVVPCVQDSGQPPIQEMVADGIDSHHMNGHHESAAPDQDTASRDCSCCDECSTMCPTSGCSPAAITSKPFDSLCPGDHQGKVLPDLMYTTPIPHPLFRPPIALAN